MPDLTASDEVLIAAASIGKGDLNKEFTEWDLTYETWKMDNNRWGMRGYEERFPDHKRVMNEIMGKGSIVDEGLLERTRTNHYRVTPAGHARSLALINPHDTYQRSYPIYDDIYEFAYHRVFEAHRTNKEEPRTWLGAAAFLGLHKHDPKLLEHQLSRLRKGIERAENFLHENGMEAFQRGDRGKKIDSQRLEELKAFINVLEDRFRAQFDAIRKKATA